MPSVSAVGACVVALCLLLLLRSMVALYGLAEHSTAPRNGTCGHSMTLQSLCVDEDGARIFYGGELGAELLLALPAAYHFWTRNELAETRACGDMSAFFYFSANHHNVACTRRYLPAGYAEFGWPRGPHSVTPPAAWQPPPLRRHHHNLGFRLPGSRVIDASLPVVLVQNKYQTEWLEPPINYFSLLLLQAMFAELRAHGCQIIYSRPMQFPDLESDNWELGEFAWLQNQTDVLNMRDIAAANPRLSYNELQLRVFSRATHAITVQGGPAILSGYVVAPGHDVLVLHKRGRETLYSEYELLFECLNGARYTVAHSEDELLSILRDKARVWGAA